MFTLWVFMWISHLMTPPINAVSTREVRTQIEGDPCPKPQRNPSPIEQSAWCRSLGRCSHWIRVTLERTVYWCRYRGVLVGSRDQ